MVARSWDPACQYVKLAADGQRPTQKYEALRVTRGSLQGTRKAPSSPGGPEDMLVTWLDQEARADERYEIRESTSLGQCHVRACVRQAIQLAAV